MRSLPLLLLAVLLAPVAVAEPGEGIHDPLDQQFSCTDGEHVCSCDAAFTVDIPGTARDWIDFIVSCVVAPHGPCADTSGIVAILPTVKAPRLP
jgi:hypothetical protein